ncbi:uncharacterized protein LOC123404936 [Hordeum vulgare subsp. vulgare]|uniref:uncharacterized protein LOC123404936 n=1 Tax=Hordeum vulgare subsp. vulgare TaxID=112509 RepID=UPI001D1A38A9|nr:uncharacterized protein LOC123404936 [Hordeum vulgare subsp. vulgare]
METKKRAATIAALCLLLVMSVPSQQRMAAKSFCECFQPCHDGCSHNAPWWTCNVDCVEKCKDVGYREESLAACYWVCGTDSACGPSAAPTDAEGVTDCKGECFKRWGNV